MVFTSIVRQTATKRIPLIKFRRQREEAAAARSESLSNADSKSKSSSPAAVSLANAFDGVQQGFIVYD